MAMRHAHGAAAATPATMARLGLIGGDGQQTTGQQHDDDRTLELTLHNNSLGVRDNRSTDAALTLTVAAVEKQGHHACLAVGLPYLQDAHG